MNDNISPVNVPTPHVLLLGLGGTGVNLIDLFLNQVDASGYEDIFDTATIDASTANVNFRTRNPTHSFLLRDKNNKPLEGAGQDRSVIYGPAKVQVPEFMSELDQYEYVILVTSLTGGSGSLLTPFAVKHLLENEKKFVVLTVSENNTAMNNRNVINTLTGLRNMAKSHERSIVGLPYKNAKGNNRAVADEEMLKDMLLLLSLFSHKAAELDRADLNSFLGYHSMMDIEPDLVELTIVNGEDGYAKDDVLAVATLSVQGDNPILEGVDVDIHVKGFIVGAQHSDIRDSLPVHFVINEGTYIEDAIEQAALFEERAESRSKRKPARAMPKLTQSVKEGDDGIPV